MHVLQYSHGALPKYTHPENTVRVSFNEDRVHTHILSAQGWVDHPNDTTTERLLLSALRTAKTEGCLAHEDGWAVDFGNSKNRTLETVWKRFTNDGEVILEQNEVPLERRCQLLATIALRFQLDALHTTLV